MASKSAQYEPEKAELIEALLEHCDQTLDRVKVLYEQFFLGIQKQPPSHLHTDVERKLRELQQMQIRNTALRYRFATIQQKFGSYNNYWRRTLRQIENGTYHRNLAKIGRQAALTGEDIPEEILAAMPKRMREQVKRDREAALATKRRREQTIDEGDAFSEELDTHTNPALPKVTRSGAHILDDDDADFDLDAYFKSVTNEDTSPDAKAFTGEVPTPTPAPGTRPTPPTARSPRAPTFEGEQVTDAEPIDPPTYRAPRHPNPAVRAAVGMRIATSPAGLPRVTPTGMRAVAPPRRPSQPMPAQPGPANRSGEHPAVPPNRTGPQPPVPSNRSGAQPAIPAPSQGARPLPVLPGASVARGPVVVESLSGPFPRPPHESERPSTPPSPPVRRGPPPPPPPGRTQPIKPARASTQPGVGRTSPPPGMTDADVNALYAKYVKAKEAVGEKAGPGSYGKLLQTINAQAPKIMEQYKAKGVDFQVVVKDNQVVIRAKPKP